MTSSHPQGPKAPSFVDAALAFATWTFAALALQGAAQAQFPCNTPAAGVDLVVGRISGSALWGTAGGQSAYSFGTTLCNVGSVAATYEASTPNHPLVGQNLYRIEDGRLEQIGMGWMRHTWLPLQQSLCCTCNPAAGGMLGPGCSDTNSTAADGIQGSLGPRSQVNGFTGSFPYPFQTAGQTGDAVYKRLQAPTMDIDPGVHPGAVYVGETFTVDPTDAAAGNGQNGFSWQPLTRNPFPTGAAYRLQTIGATTPLQPAIHAWQALEPAVVLRDVQVPGEGLFVAASHAIPNGNGTWRYEYAVQNINSDLSGQRFSVDVGTATVTDVGMSFPAYHSGEPYTNAAWAASTSGGSVAWECAGFAQNQNANALRFGTTYSFWFTADEPPTAGDVTLGLFKPGGPGPQTVQLDVPSAGPVTAANYCTANPNSTFMVTGLWVSNVDLNARSMDLEVSSMPAGQFGFIATSLTPDQVDMPGGSAGNLCIGGAIGRLVGGVVFQSDSSGAATVPVDLDTVPTPNGTTQVMAGETRYFQAWHRDLTFGGMATSNFSRGLSLSFL